MRRDQFLAWAIASGVRADAFALDGGHPSDAYVLDRQGSVWVVYYSERGLEQDRQLFTSETDALSELQARLVKTLNVPHDD